jgi:restriction endonuclease S subunit
MTLKDFVEIKSGRTFKNGVSASDEPTHSVIQLRDFDKDDDENSIKWEKLSKTSIISSRLIHVLEPNDIIMVAKGPSKKAILLQSIPKNIVPTQHFLIIKVTAKESLMVEFLEHYLNSSIVQRWIEDNGGGSYQSTISIATLSKLPLPDVSYRKQCLIAETADSVKKEICLHKLLIKSREQEIDKMFNDLQGRLK